MRILPGCVCVSIILLAALSPAFSQLVLHQENGRVTVSSIDVFLEKNNFDYAIAAQLTSQRIGNPKEISCLVKQKNSWFLVLVSEPAATSSVIALRAKPIVKQLALSGIQADSLLKLIKPEEGVKYSQADLYKLPSTCDVFMGSKKATFGGVSDAATYYLAERSGAAVRSISFYAPDIFLKRCEANNPQFNILTGLVNSVEKLSNVALKMLN